MEQVNSLNHKFTKVEAEDKAEVTMTDVVMITKAIRTDIGQIVADSRQYRQDRGRPSMNKITGEEISEEI